ncbi:hypothetical protein AADR41_00120 [Streptomyces sp. CLV115]|uniref:hypothetical protein n=1 Tax=Streptomyces sp. CLV115 TaxID=3138502 RepID=UPI00313D6FF1
MDLVNPFIGTSGKRDADYGGMIPSTAPPFAMTRWSPMTRQNYVSRTPYHYDDKKIGGFIGTHQPAIWMGDSGYVTGMPGIGTVKTAADDRALPFSHADEQAAADRYSVRMRAGSGRTLKTEMTGTSRVGLLRTTYPADTDTNFVLQATRSGITGKVHVDPAAREITGYNPDRQDSKLGPFKASNFKGYFVARFDTAFDSHGTATGAKLHEGQNERTAGDLSAYVRFPSGTRTVQVRIATSFISLEQARANLAAEAPDDQSFERTAAKTRAQEPHGAAGGGAHRRDRHSECGTANASPAKRTTSLHHHGPEPEMRIPRPGGTRPCRTRPHGDQRALRALWTLRAIFQHTPTAP